MKAVESRRKLEELIKLADMPLEMIRPEQLIEIFLDFYENHRSEDCLIEMDGDMLLFEWGIYGSILGPNFHLSLTRQFAIGEDEDPKLYQLTIDFEYLPTDELILIGLGNRWCHSPEKRRLDDFDTFIRGSLAYQSTKEVPPTHVTMDFSCVC